MVLYIFKRMIGAIDSNIGKLFNTNLYAAKKPFFHIIFSKQMQHFAFVTTTENNKKLAGLCFLRQASGIPSIFQYSYTYTHNLYLPSCVHIGTNLTLML